MVDCSETPLSERDLLILAMQPDKDDFVQSVGYFPPVDSSEDLDGGVGVEDRRPACSVGEGTTSGLAKLEQSTEPSEPCPF